MSQLKGSLHVDVYHVYSKSILSDASEDRLEHSVSFIDRVEEQMEKSKRRLAKIEEDYNKLLLKRVETEWVSEDEDKLLEYDDLLERHYGAVKMSTHLKKGDYSDKVLDLITVTKELLQEIRGNGQNS